MKAKNDKWKERAIELIREGKNFQSTNKTLLEEHEQGIGGSTYRRFKQEINPSHEMDRALEEHGKQRVEQDKGQSSRVRANKWSSKKQKDADNSNLAKLINEGIFHASLPFCKSRQLKKEDVQEINVGGSAVACVLFFFPDIDLNHPAVVLATRIVLFYIKFRQICSVMNQKVAEVKDKISGLKPGWGEEEK